MICTKQERKHPAGAHLHQPRMTRATASNQPTASDNADEGSERKFSGLYPILNKPLPQNRRKWAVRLPVLQTKKSSSRGGRGSRLPAPWRHAERAAASFPPPSLPPSPSPPPPAPQPRPRRRPWTAQASGRRSRRSPDGDPECRPAARGASEGRGGRELWGSGSQAGGGAGRASGARGEARAGGSGSRAGGAAGARAGRAESASGGKRSAP